MEHSDKFVVRCYEKKLLAEMYFPETNERVAVNKLRRWIRSCAPLMQELCAGDFHPNTKSFTAREVRLITYHLGLPGEY